MREIWKPISYGYYEASNLGRIRRSVEGKRTFVGKVLKIQHSTRYPHVILSLGDRRLKQVSVHRLIADAFLGPCPVGMVVNHKDLNKTNNSETNLEYVTPKRNGEHARQHGVLPRGENHGMAKLGEAEVRAIRQCDTAATILAVRYGVTDYHIRAIRRRVTWGHV